MRAEDLHRAVLLVDDIDLGEDSPNLRLCPQHELGPVPRGAKGPLGVEKERLVREPGRLRHHEVFDLDLVRAGHLAAQPVDQCGSRLIRIALSTYWHDSPNTVICPTSIDEPATRPWRADGSGQALESAKKEISPFRVWEVGKALAS